MILVVRTIDFGVAVFVGSMTPFGVAVVVHPATHFCIAIVASLVNKLRSKDKFCFSTNLGLTIRKFTDTIGAVTFDDLPILLEIASLFLHS